MNNNTETPKKSLTEANDGKIMVRIADDCAEYNGKEITSMFFYHPLYFDNAALLL